MEDEFELIVQYKGKEVIYPARLLLQGYIYKVEVIVDGQQIIFERDEEREWRVLLANPDQKQKEISKDLLGILVNSLEKISG